FVLKTAFADVAGFIQHQGVLNPGPTNQASGFKRFYFREESPRAGRRDLAAEALGVDHEVAVLILEGRMARLIHQDRSNPQLIGRQSDDPGSALFRPNRSGDPP